MFTRSEKQVILLVISLLGLGFVSRIFTGDSLLKDQDRERTQWPVSHPDSGQATKCSGCPVQAGMPDQGQAGTTSFGSNNMNEITSQITRPRDSQKKDSPHKPLININSATKDGLVSLPGIGPVLAHRIIEHRQKFGDFKNQADILKIKGIGAKKLAKISPLIEFQTRK